MVFIKIKNIYSSKDTVKKMKMHARYYKKINNVKYIFDSLHPEYIYKNQKQTQKAYTTQ